MNGCRISRKLKRNFINRLGIDVIKKRFNEDDVPMDAFGEPTGDPAAFFAEETIKIVIDTDKRSVEETVIGGIPDDGSKEIFQFYCAGDVDVKTGDKIVYPVDTPNEWIVFFVSPNIHYGINVLNEVKCHRDRRY